MRIGVTAPRIAGGALRFRVTGRDPYVARRRLAILAQSCRVLVIRMRKQAGKRGQVFWATNHEPQFSDKRYLNYDTPADGQFHDVRVPVGEHPNWRGTIVALRIDPDVVGEPGEVAIESVRAEP